MRYTFSDYQKAADAVKQKLGGFQPEVAMILGSGLGDMADLAEHPLSFPTVKFPVFPFPPLPATRASWCSAHWPEKTLP